MAKIELIDCSVSYRDDPDTKEVIFQKILKFYLEYRLFSGESIMQDDDAQLYGPVLLADIVDDILCFEVDWNE